MKYKNTPTPQIANEKFHIFLTSLNDQKKKVGPKLFPMQPLIKKKKKNQFFNVKENMKLKGPPLLPNFPILPHMEEKKKWK